MNSVALIIVLAVRVMPLIIVFAFFVSRESKKQKIEKTMIEKGLDPEFIIKYDVQDLKVYRVISIVALVIGIIMAIMLSANSLLSTTVQVTLYFSVLVFAGLAIYSIYKLIKASEYLHSLKRQGYILPDNKAEYSYAVEMLIKEDEVEMPEVERDKRSLVFSVIALVIFLACIIYNVIFIRIYYYFDSDVAIFMSVLDLFWLFAAFMFYRQSNNKKYRNDGEIVRAKKNRMTLAASIFFIIFFLGATLFVKNMCYTMLRYIAKSKAQQNVEYQIQMGKDFSTIAEEQGEIPEDVLQELKEGTDITQWENDCEFKSAFLDKYDKNSFSELRDLVRNKDGVPKIIVKYENDEFTVTFENVYSIK